MTDPIKILLVVSLALTLAACDAKTTTGGDSAPPDTGARDGPRTDASADQRSHDLSPDGPRPPAEWKTAQGVAPLIEDHTVTVLGSGDVLIVGGYNSNLRAAEMYSNKAYLYRAKQNDFVSAGTLAEPRANHAASLLDDGRVLVTGGDNDQDYLQSTEIYDPTKPAAAAWSKGPPMFKSRWSHSSTNLGNGEVLVAGGFYSADSTATLVIFDYKANGWKALGQTLTDARKSHTATLLKDGKLLFAGGSQGYSSSMRKTTYLDSLEIYDPAKGTVTLLKAKMSKKRVAHTATPLTDGRVLIVGGICGGPNCGDNKQVDDIYDPLSDKISPLGHPGPLPSSHVAARLKDGRVLVAGSLFTTSAASLLFDPQKGGSWSTGPSLAKARWGAAAGLLKDGTVLVVGGVQTSTPKIYADRAERFYP